MSSSREKVAAREPRRERGRLRVEALLRAAGSLFAEKGYDAVTMTEVAARAGAPIGSLYQFFPGKEALADALLDRFGERLAEGLDPIEARGASASTAEVVDALIGLLPGMKEERAAMAALIESRQESSARALELRTALRARVARILRARLPEITPDRAEIMALVVIQLMKAAARSGEKDPETADRVLDELKALTRLYLASPLPPPEG